MKNRETQIGLEISTAQNQWYVQVFPTTRDNISGKQTVPAVVRPKTKIQEPRVDSGELDINIQNLKEHLCQTQTENVQQTAISRKDLQLSVSSWYYSINYDCSTSREQLSDSTDVQFSDEFPNKPLVLRNTQWRQTKRETTYMLQMESC